MQLSRWKRIALALGLLAAAACGCVLFLLTAGPDPRRVQQLEDGSKIALTRFSYNNTNIFTHGIWLERMLGNAIPKKGIKFGSFQLQRPTQEQFPNDDGHGLNIEFKRLTTNAPGQVPIASRPQRWVRCVIVSDDGSEYLAEFHNPGIMVIDGPPEYVDDSMHPAAAWDFFNSTRRAYPEGQFEYVTSTAFPHASKWLTVRLEANDSASPGVPDGKWKPFASFRIRNPGFAQPNLWTASSLPATNRIGEFDFVLGAFTVHPPRFPGSYSTERELTISLQVLLSNAVQSSWRVVSMRFEDALGGMRERGHPFHFDRGWLTQNDRVTMEPRNAWKLGLDFVRIADFGSQPFGFGGDWNQIHTAGLDPESVCTVRVPRAAGAVLLTNLHGLPMRITQSGSSGSSNGRNYLGYQIQITAPHPELRVLDVGSGQRMLESEPLQPANPGRPAYMSAYDSGAAELELTFALVKICHVEFFVQPKVTDQPPPPPGQPAW